MSKDPFNAWIRIHPDGQIQLVLNKSEMGQGVFTALPMILAEEAEIDFSRITVIQADDADGTGGSGSVAGGYKPLRQAGAQVREVMIAAAARRWAVPTAQCRARNSQIIDTSSGRTLSYAALVKEARRLPLPDAKTVPLKDPKDFSLLGRSVRHLDIPHKVKGAARFGLDVRLPGMVYAVVAQCPYFRGELVSYDAAKAKAIPGVLEVFDIPTDLQSANKNTREVAVVATNTWAAIQGRNALATEWKSGQYHDESTETLTTQLRAALDAPEYWNSTNTELNPDIVPAAKRLEAIYEFPFLAHVTMEPMNITVSLEGGRCEIWSPTQAGEGTRETAAKLLGIDKKNVTVHVTFMGGGFGRRFGAPFDHQAIHIARSVRRPVQLIWTREDDFTHDRYRPAGMHRLRAGIDQEGTLVSWTDRLVDTTIIGQGDPKQAQLFELGGALDQPYPAQHFRISYVPIDSGATRGAWRGVEISFNVFAVESFIDELAHLAGQDPCLYRRRLFENTAAQTRTPRSNFDGALADPKRMIEMLDLTAEKAAWGKPLGVHRGRGISCFFSKTTYLAQVTEVTVKKGNISVDRVVTVVDPGTVINMNGIRAQIEGAILMGLSATLKERITVKDGMIQQQNFNSYDLLRMPDTPHLETHLVEGGRLPGGIGEPPLALIAPSVGNAIFAATGKRLRKLPLQLDEVSS
ncbi:xanthine dehydrogenase family protein molybdopterin-binding subunit [Terriglobus saanensis]|uniref:xanthine dehydrogenase family protein molybdopterin-binding subunit n=1 Tax=Terriglobus saanensis TaxID=870903 RepID=UPI0001E51A87|nr:molybdopterin cofactor-binding domain-containing protein [Terriglobus saanensis]